MPGFNGTGPTESGWGTGTCRSNNVDENNEGFGPGMGGRGGGRGRGGRRCRGGIGAGFGRCRNMQTEAPPRVQKGSSETPDREEG
jgi:hypothetical protein